MGFLPAHYKQLSTIPAYKYINITHHQANRKAIHSCFYNLGLELLQQHMSEGLNEKEDMLNKGKYYMQIVIVHDWVTKKECIQNLSWFKLLTIQCCAFM